MPRPNGLTLNTADEIDKRERRRELDIAAFWERVKSPDGCLLYYGAKEANGYGYVKNPLPDGPQFLTAHRLAWILKKGPIPEGLQVLHKCDIRACCNVDHLFLGDATENMRDMRSKGRSGGFGERSIHAKLTDEAVREIRRDYKMRNKRDTNAKELAARYGVGSGAICAIIRGETWTHVK